MNQIFSSLLETSIVFLTGITIATLVVKLVLVLRWRQGSDVHRHGSLASFLLIVSPSLAMLLWFISADLHLVEGGELWGVCALTHGVLKANVDSLLLSLLLVVAVSAGLAYRWRLNTEGVRGVLPARYTERLARLCQESPVLKRLHARVKLVSEQAHPICTRGFFRPQIELNIGLMECLNDDALRSALLHEAAHVGGRDPLRYLLASVALAVNPLGFLLRKELLRWRACREAVCDREAVGGSADPLSLAEAIVTASRLNQRLQPMALGLGGGDRGLLSLRVHLLLSYASRLRQLPPATPSWLTAGVLGALVCLSPHMLGPWPLDGVHGVAEKLLSMLGQIQI